MEQEACAAEGALDMGSHIIAVVAKRVKGESKEAGWRPE
jgi:hypothetical protein